MLYPPAYASQVLETGKAPPDQAQDPYNIFLEKLKPMAMTSSGALESFYFLCLSFLC